MAGFAAREDDQDPGKGNQHPCDLPQAGALTLENPRAKEDEQRRGRIEQHGIDRRGSAKSEIDQGLEDDDAGERKKQYDAGVAAQRSALAHEAGQRERRKQDGRDEPAPEIERERVEGVAQRAPDDPVSGPQQVGGRKQKEGIKPRARHRGSLREGERVPRIEILECASVAPMSRPGSL